MASARRSCEGPLFQLLPFLERPRASFYLAPSFSLGLGQSADHSNAPYRNYDCRHCHVTARTARSRINETASKSRPPPALPSLSALHFACSATPGDLPPSIPDIRFPSVARSASRSHFWTVSLISLSFTRDSPPCDRLPLVSPPYLTASPSDPSLPLPGPALTISMYRGSTCLALSELILISRNIVYTNGIENYLETELYLFVILSVDELIINL